MKAKSLWVGIGLSLFGIVAACSSSSDKAEGAEGGNCFPNGMCNAGLTCVSNYCVNKPGGSSSSGSGTGGTTAGTTAGTTSGGTAGTATGGSMTGGTTSGATTTGGTATGGTATGGATTTGGTATGGTTTGGTTSGGTTSGGTTGGGGCSALYKPCTASAQCCAPAVGTACCRPTGLDGGSAGFCAVRHAGGTCL